MNSKIYLKNKINLYKLITLFLFCIVFLVSCSSSKDLFNISTGAVKKDIINFTLQDVLIVGSGSTPTRIFLENISSQLKIDLLKNDIKSEFTYLGKTERKTNISSSEFASSLHKAYLLFTPADTSQFENYTISNSYTVPNLVGPVGGAILRSHASHNYYNEIFFVELFSSNNLQSPLLIMKLSVDFDFGKKK